MENGNAAAYRYDKNSRVTRIRKVDHSTVSGSNDTITMTTDFKYDNWGQLIKRIEKPQNPDAQSDSSWQTTEYEYDKLGNRMLETRPNGVEAAYEYDLLGRKTQMSIDPSDANQVTVYGYDVLGRQVWIEGSTDDTDDDTNQRTAYTYDDLGRITHITYPNQATIEYAYNKAGKVIRRTDQRGIVTDYDYDDAYNMIQKQVTMDSVTTTENFAYDGLGRMLSAQKLEGAAQISLSEFAYNDIGRISNAEETYFSFATKSVGYAYDNAGYRIQTDYPDGSTTVDRTNTWDGRIDTLTQDSATLVTYGYIGARTAQRKSGSYIYYAPEYDNLGRMTRSYTYQTNGTTSTITDFDYTYVANTSNIETITFDHRPNTPYNQYAYDNLDRLTEADYLVGVLADQNEVFAMDDLGNRTTVNLRSGANEVYDVNTLTNCYASIDSNSLAYDAAGNLTQDKNGYTYHYDYENRITEIRKTSDTVTVAQFAYDALGRRIKKTDSIASETTYYYYNDQWQILTEQVVSEWYTWFNSYVYGNYIDEVLKFQYEDEGLLYYLHDHLYSPVALVKECGFVTERHEYDAYGKVTISYCGEDDTWFTADDEFSTFSYYGNPFTFTGRQLDTLDSGALHHMHYRHRDYSPTMGRFLQHDPLGVNVRLIYYQGLWIIGLEGPSSTVVDESHFGPKTNSRTILQGFAFDKNYRPIKFGQYSAGLNLYTMVQSNPVFYRDPFGFYPWGQDWDYGSCLGYCALRGGFEFIPGAGDAAQELLDDFLKAAAGQLGTCYTATQASQCAQNCWMEDLYGPGKSMMPNDDPWPAGTDHNQIKFIGLIFFFTFCILFTKPVRGDHL